MATHAIPDSSDLSRCPTNDSPMVALDFFENVYAPMRLRGASLTTHLQYGVQIRHLGRYLQREATLEDFTDETISRFLAWFKGPQDSQRAAPTVNKARSHLLALWRYAARKRLVKDFPDVPAEREPAIAPIAWKRDQLTRLHAACAEQPGYVCGIHANLWWVGLHCVLWDTAERIGAVLELRWKNCDLDSGWLVVPAEFRKGKKGDKTTRLHQDSIAMLRKFHDIPNRRIFPWGLAPSTIYLHYKRILARAGLPNTRKYMFHAMRKSAASWFEAAGGDATALLDHSSRKVTKESYLDPTIVEAPQASDRLFRMGG